MHTIRRHLRLHAATPVLVLVLALLWSVGWGQVHRVLHPGAQFSTVVEVSGKAVVAELADDHGSSLCQLLDHLTHGAGPTAEVAAFIAHWPAQVPGPHPAIHRHLTTRRSFDARGPPSLT